MTLPRGMCGRGLGPGRGVMQGGCPDVMHARRFQDFWFIVEQHQGLCLSPRLSFVGGAPFRGAQNNHSPAVGYPLTAAGHFGYPPTAVNHGPAGVVYRTNLIECMITHFPFSFHFGSALGRTLPPCVHENGSNC